VPIVKIALKRTHAGRLLTLRRAKELARPVARKRDGAVERGTLAQISEHRAFNTRLNVFSRAA
jgi:hypothetical protein